MNSAGSLPFTWSHEVADGEDTFTFSMIFATVVVFDIGVVFKQVSSALWRSQGWVPWLSGSHPLFSSS